MVVFLLVIVIGILFFILSKIGSRFDETEQSINKLHEKINSLKEELSAKSIVESKPVVKEETKPIQEVIKPIVIEKPIETLEPIKLKTIEEPTEIKSVADKNIDIVGSFSSPKVAPPKVVAPPEKSWYEKFKENNPDIEKFIGENLINKIGILILVLGISFFVKFAIDKNWINEPARVGIGILCGSLVMGIAHKLKKNYKAFSSVFVAGAISIFYFTIAIAFHDYHLFSQTVAFIIMVVITAFSVLVSVSYDRQELAVLSLIGGFAVPFMLSTGEGNYIVLFTYIAILNIGILSIAYFKKWNLVIIVSFAFTLMLFSGWYTKELYDNKLPHLGALLFASLFYVIFSLATVVNNLRNKGVFSTIEYVIIVANTFFFFGMGMGIIHNWGIEMKGVFTLSLALYNLIYAIFLYKKFGLDKNAIYLLIGLTLTFATLTIPIQFKGNYITLFWAAEAVLLFWMSQKSKINGFKIGAIIVQGLMLISLLLDWFENYVWDTEVTLKIILNPIFVTGIVALGSLIATYFLLKKEQEDSKLFFITFNPKIYRQIILVLSVFVAYFVGILEINYQSEPENLITNSSSAFSCSVLYHYLFCLALLYFGMKKDNLNIKKALIVLATLNIVLYVVVFYKIPADELRENLSQNLNSHTAFYFHYLIFICLAYSIFVIVKSTIKNPVLDIYKSKLSLWFLAFCMVYILSNEVMIHGLYLTPNIVTQKELAAKFPSLKNDNSYVISEFDYYVKGRMDDIKRQIVKIGYPILWGVLSFVFLIVGIKRQWKQLRIIALSLLGITILKLFLYDINNVSETGKIVAFILLGVLILIISFVYQKIKKLVVDEPKIASDEKDN